MTASAANSGARDFFAGATGICVAPGKVGVPGATVATAGAAIEDTGAIGACELTDGGGVGARMPTPGVTGVARPIKVAAGPLGAAVLMLSGPPIDTLGIFSRSAISSCVLW